MASKTYTKTSRTSRTTMLTSRKRRRGVKIELKPTDPVSLQELLAYCSKKPLLKNLKSRFANILCFINPIESPSTERIEDEKVSIEKLEDLLRKNLEGARKKSSLLKKSVLSKRGQKLSSTNGRKSEEKMIKCDKSGCSKNVSVNIIQDGSENKNATQDGKESLNCIGNQNDILCQEGIRKKECYQGKDNNQSQNDEKQSQNDNHDHHKDQGFDLNGSHCFSHDQNEKQNQDENIYREQNQHQLQMRTKILNQIQNRIQSQMQNRLKNEIQNELHNPHQNDSQNQLKCCVDYENKLQNQIQSQTHFLTKEKCKTVYKTDTLLMDQLQSNTKKNTFESLEKRDSVQTKDSKEIDSKKDKKKCKSKKVQNVNEKLTWGEIAMKNEINNTKDKVIKQTEVVNLMRDKVSMYEEKKNKTCKVTPITQKLITQNSRANSAENETLLTETIKNINKSSTEISEDKMSKKNSFENENKQNKNKIRKKKMKKVEKSKKFLKNEILETILIKEALKEEVAISKLLANEKLKGETLKTGIVYDGPKNEINESIKREFWIEEAKKYVSGMNFYENQAVVEATVMTVSETKKEISKEKDVKTSELVVTPESSLRGMERSMGVTGTVGASPGVRDQSPINEEQLKILGESSTVTEHYANSIEPSTRETECYPRTAEATSKGVKQSPVEDQCTRSVQFNRTGQISRNLEESPVILKESRRTSEQSPRTLEKTTMNLEQSSLVPENPQRVAEESARFSGQPLNTTEHSQEHNNIPQNSGDMLETSPINLPPPINDDRLIEMKNLEYNLIRDFFLKTLGPPKQIDYSNGDYVPDDACKDLKFLLYPFGYEKRETEAEKQEQSHQNKVKKRRQVMGGGMTTTPITDLHSLEKFINDKSGQCKCKQNCSKSCLRLNSNKEADEDENNRKVEKEKEANDTKSLNENKRDIIEENERNTSRENKKNTREENNIKLEEKTNMSFTRESKIPKKQLSSSLQGAIIKKLTKPLQHEEKKAINWVKINGNIDTSERSSSSEESDKKGRKAGFLGGIDQKRKAKKKESTVSHDSELTDKVSVEDFFEGQSRFISRNFPFMKKNRARKVKRAKKPMVGEEIGDSNELGYITYYPKDQPQNGRGEVKLIKKYEDGTSLRETGTNSYEKNHENVFRGKEKLIRLISFDNERVNKHRRNKDEACEATVNQTDVSCGGGSENLCENFEDLRDRCDDSCTNSKLKKCWRRNASSNQDSESKEYYKYEKERKNNDKWSRSEDIKNKKQISEEERKYRRNKESTNINSKIYKETKLNKENTEEHFTNKNKQRTRKTHLEEKTSSLSKNKNNISVLSYYEDEEYISDLTYLEYENEPSVKEVYVAPRRTSYSEEYSDGGSSEEVYCARNNSVKEKTRFTSHKISNNNELATMVVKKALKNSSSMTVEEKGGQSPKEIIQRKNSQRRNVHQCSPKENSQRENQIKNHRESYRKGNSHREYFQRVNGEKESYQREITDAREINQREITEKENTQREGKQNEVTSKLHRRDEHQSEIASMQESLYEGDRRTHRPNRWKRSNSTERKLQKKTKLCEFSDRNPQNPYATKQDFLEERSFFSLSRQPTIVMYEIQSGNVTGNEDAAAASGSHADSSSENYNGEFSSNSTNAVYDSEVSLQNESAYCAERVSCSEANEIAKKNDNEDKESKSFKEKLKILKRDKKAKQSKDKQQEERSKDNGKKKKSDRKEKSSKRKRGMDFSDQDLFLQQLGGNYGYADCPNLNQSNVKKVEKTDPNQTSTAAPQDKTRYRVENTMYYFEQNDKKGIESTKKKSFCAQLEEYKKMKKEEKKEDAPTPFYVFERKKLRNSKVEYREAPICDLECVMNMRDFKEPDETEDCCAGKLLLVQGRKPGARALLTKPPCFPDDFALNKRDDDEYHDEMEMYGKNYQKYIWTDPPGFDAQLGAEDMKKAKKKPECNQRCKGRKMLTQPPQTKGELDKQRKEMGKDKGKNGQKREELPYRQLAAEQQMSSSRGEGTTTPPQQSIYGDDDDPDKCSVCSYEELILQELEMEDQIRNKKRQVFLGEAPTPSSEFRMVRNKKLEEDITKPLYEQHFKPQQIKKRIWTKAPAFDEDLEAPACVICPDDCTEVPEKIKRNKVPDRLVKQMKKSRVPTCPKTLKAPCQITKECAYVEKKNREEEEKARIKMEEEYEKCENERCRSERRYSEDSSRDDGGRDDRDRDIRSRDDRGRNKDDRDDRGRSRDDRAWDDREMDKGRSCFLCDRRPKRGESPVTSKDSAQSQQQNDDAQGEIPQCGGRRKMHSCKLEIGTVSCQDYPMDCEKYKLKKRGVVETDNSIFYENNQKIKNLERAEEKKEELLKPIYPCTPYSQPPEEETVDEPNTPCGGICSGKDKGYYKSDKPTPKLTDQEDKRIIKCPFGSECKSSKRHRERKRGYDSPDADDLKYSSRERSREGSPDPERRRKGRICKDKRSQDRSSSRGRRRSKDESQEERDASSPRKRKNYEVYYVSEHRKVLQAPQSGDLYIPNFEDSSAKEEEEKDIAVSIYEGSLLTPEVQSDTVEEKRSENKEKINKDSSKAAKINEDRSKRGFWKIFSKSQDRNQMSTYEKNRQDVESEKDWYEDVKTVNNNIRNRNSESRGLWGFFGKGKKNDIDKKTSADKKVPNTISSASFESDISYSKEDKNEMKPLSTEEFTSYSEEKSVNGNFSGGTSMGESSSVGKISQDASPDGKVKEELNNVKSEDEDGNVNESSKDKVTNDLQNVQNCEDVFSKISSEKLLNVIESPRSSYNIIGYKKDVPDVFEEKLIITDKSRRFSAPAMSVGGLACTMKKLQEVGEQLAISVDKTTKILKNAALKKNVMAALQDNNKNDLKTEIKILYKSPRRSRSPSPKRIDKKVPKIKENESEKVDVNIQVPVITSRATGTDSSRIFGGKLRRTRSEDQNLNKKTVEKNEEKIKKKEVRIEDGERISLQGTSKRAAVKISAEISVKDEETCPIETDRKKSKSTANKSLATDVRGSVENSEKNNFKIITVVSKSVNTGGGKQNENVHYLRRQKSVTNKTYARDMKDQSTVPNNTQVMIKKNFKGRCEHKAEEIDWGKICKNKENDLNALKKFTIETKLKKETCNRNYEYYMENCKNVKVNEYFNKSEILKRTKNSKKETEAKIGLFHVYRLEVDNIKNNPFPGLYSFSQACQTRFSSEDQGKIKSNSLPNLMKPNSNIEALRQAKSLDEFLSKHDKWEPYWRLKSYLRPISSKESLLNILHPTVAIGKKPKKPIYPEEDPPPILSELASDEILAHLETKKPQKKKSEEIERGDDEGEPELRVSDESVNIVDLTDLPLPVFKDRKYYLYEIFVESGDEEKVLPEEVKPSEKEEKEEKPLEEKEDEESPEEEEERPLDEEEKLLDEEKPLEDEGIIPLDEKKIPSKEDKEIPPKEDKEISSKEDEEIVPREDKEILLKEDKIKSLEKGDAENEDLLSKEGPVEEDDLFGAVLSSEEIADEEEVPSMSLKRKDLPSVVLKSAKLPSQEAVKKTFSSDEKIIKKIPTSEDVRYEEYSVRKPATEDYPRKQIFKPEDFASEEPPFETSQPGRKLLKPGVFSPTDEQIKKQLRTFEKIPPERNLSVEKITDADRFPSFLGSQAYKKFSKEKPTPIGLLRKISKHEPKICGYKQRQVCSCKKCTCPKPCLNETCAGRDKKFNHTCECTNKSGEENEEENEKEDEELCKCTDIMCRANKIFKRTCEETCEAVNLNPCKHPEASTQSVCWKSLSEPDLERKRVRISVPEVIKSDDRKKFTGQRKLKSILRSSCCRLKKEYDEETQTDIEVIYKSPNIENMSDDNGYVLSKETLMIVPENSEENLDRSYKEVGTITEINYMKGGNLYVGGDIYYHEGDECKDTDSKETIVFEEIPDHYYDPTMPQYEILLNDEADAPHPKEYYADPDDIYYGENDDDYYWSDPYEPKRFKYWIGRSNHWRKLRFGSQRPQVLFRKSRGILKRLPNWFIKSPIYELNRRNIYRIRRLAEKKRRKTDDSIRRRPDLKRCSDWPVRNYDWSEETSDWHEDALDWCYGSPTEPETATDWHEETSDRHERTPYLPKIIPNRSYNPKWLKKYHKWLKTRERKNHGAFGVRDAIKSCGTFFRSNTPHHVTFRDVETYSEPEEFLEYSRSDDEEEEEMEEDLVNEGNGTNYRSIGLQYEKYPDGYKPPEVSGSNIIDRLFATNESYETNEPYEINEPEDINDAYEIDETYETDVSPENDIIYETQKTQDVDRINNDNCGVNIPCQRSVENKTHKIKYKSHRLQKSGIFKKFYPTNSRIRSNKVRFADQEFQNLEETRSFNSMEEIEDNGFYDNLMRIYHLQGRTRVESLGQAQKPNKLYEKKSDQVVKIKADSDNDNLSEFNEEILKYPPSHLLIISKSSESLKSTPTPCQPSKSLIYSQAIHISSEISCASLKALKSPKISNSRSYSTLFPRYNETTNSIEFHVEPNIQKEAVKVSKLTSTSSLFLTGGSKTLITLLPPKFSQIPLTSSTSISPRSSRSLLSSTSSKLIKSSSKRKLLKSPRSTKFMEYPKTPNSPRSPRSPRYTVLPMSRRSSRSLLSRKLETPPKPLISPSFSFLSSNLNSESKIPKLRDSSVQQKCKMEKNDCMVSSHASKLNKSQPRSRSPFSSFRLNNSMGKNSPQTVLKSTSNHEPVQNTSSIKISSSLRFLLVDHPRNDPPEKSQFIDCNEYSKENNFENLFNKRNEEGEKMISQKVGAKRRKSSKEKKEEEIEEDRIFKMRKKALTNFMQSICAGKTKKNNSFKIRKCEENSEKKMLEEHEKFQDVEETSGIQSMDEDILEPKKDKNYNLRGIEEIYETFKSKSKNKPSSRYEEGYVNEFKSTVKNYINPKRKNISREKIEEYWKSSEEHFIIADQSNQLDSAYQSNCSIGCNAVYTNILRTYEERKKNEDYAIRKLVKDSETQTLDDTVRYYRHKETIILYNEIKRVGKLDLSQPPGRIEADRTNEEVRKYERRTTNAERRTDEIKRTNGAKRENEEGRKKETEVPNDGNAGFDERIRFLQKIEQNRARNIREDMFDTARMFDEENCKNFKERHDMSQINQTNETKDRRENRGEKSKGKSNSHRISNEEYVKRMINNLTYINKRKIGKSSDFGAKSTSEIKEKKSKIFGAKFEDSLCKLIEEFGRKLTKKSQETQTSSESTDEKIQEENENDQSKDIIIGDSIKEEKFDETSPIVQSKDGLLSMQDVAKILVSEVHKAMYGRPYGSPFKQETEESNEETSRIPTRRKISKVQQVERELSNFNYDSDHSRNYDFNKNKMTQRKHRKAEGENEKEEKMSFKSMAEHLTHRLFEDDSEEGRRRGKRRLEDEFADFVCKRKKIEPPIKHTEGKYKNREYLEGISEEKTDDEELAGCTLTPGDVKDERRIFFRTKQDDEDSDEDNTSPNENHKWKNFDEHSRKYKRLAQRKDIRERNENYDLEREEFEERLSRVREESKRFYEEYMNKLQEENQGRANDNDQFAYEGNTEIPNCGRPITRREVVDNLIKCICKASGRTLDKSGGDKSHISKVVTEKNDSTEVLLVSSKTNLEGDVEPIEIVVSLSKTFEKFDIDQYLLQKIGDHIVEDIIKKFNEESKNKGGRIGQKESKKFYKISIKKNAEGENVFITSTHKKSKHKKINYTDGKKEEKDENPIMEFFHKLFGKDGHPIPYIEDMKEEKSFYETNKVNEIQNEEAECDCTENSIVKTLEVEDKEEENKSVHSEKSFFSKIKSSVSFKKSSSYSRKDSSADESLDEKDSSRDHLKRKFKKHKGKDRDFHFDLAKFLHIKTAEKCQRKRLTFAQKVSYYVDTLMENFGETLKKIQANSNVKGYEERNTYRESDSYETNYANEMSSGELKRSFFKENHVDYDLDDDDDDDDEIKVLETETLRKLEYLNKKVIELRKTRNHEFSSLGFYGGDNFRNEDYTYEEDNCCPEKKLDGSNKSNRDEMNENETVTDVTVRNKGSFGRKKIDMREDELEEDYIYNLRKKKGETKINENLRKAEIEAEGCCYGEKEENLRSNDNYVRGDFHKGKSNVYRVEEMRCFNEVHKDGIKERDVIIGECYNKVTNDRQVEQNITKEINMKKSTVDLNSNNTNVCEEMCSKKEEVKRNIKLAKRRLQLVKDKEFLDIRCQKLVQKNLTKEKREVKTKIGKNCKAKDFKIDACKITKGNSMENVSTNEGRHNETENVEMNKNNEAKNIFVSSSHKNANTIAMNENLKFNRKEKHIFPSKIPIASTKKKGRNINQKMKENTKLNEICNLTMNEKEKSVSSSSSSKKELKCDLFSCQTVSKEKFEETTNDEEIWDVSPIIPIEENKDIILKNKENEHKSGSVFVFGQNEERKYEETPRYASFVPAFSFHSKLKEKQALKPETKNHVSIDETKEELIMKFAEDKVEGENIFCCKRSTKKLRNEEKQIFVERYVNLLQNEYNEENNVERADSKSVGMKAAKDEINGENKEEETEVKIEKEIKVKNMKEQKTEENTKEVEKEKKIENKIFCKNAEKNENFIENENFPATEKIYNEIFQIDEDAKESENLQWNEKMKKKECFNANLNAKESKIFHYNIKMKESKTFQMEENIEVSKKFKDFKTIKDCEDLRKMEKNELKTTQVIGKNVFNINESKKEITPGIAQLRSENTVFKIKNQMNRNSNLESEIKECAEKIILKEIFKDQSNLRDFTNKLKKENELDNITVLSKGLVEAIEDVTHLLENEISQALKHSSEESQTEEITEKISIDNSSNKENVQKERNECQKCLHNLNKKTGHTNFLQKRESEQVSSFDNNLTSSFETNSSKLSELSALRNLSKINVDEKREEDSFSSSNFTKIPTLKKIFVKRKGEDIKEGMEMEKSMDIVGKKGNLIENEIFIGKEGNFIGKDETCIGKKKCFIETEVSVLGIDENGVENDENVIRNEVKIMANKKNLKNSRENIMEEEESFLGKENFVKKASLVENPDKLIRKTAYENTFEEALDENIDKILCDVKHELQSEARKSEQKSKINSTSKPQKSKKKNVSSQTDVIFVPRISRHLHNNDHNEDHTRRRKKKRYFFDDLMAYSSAGKSVEIRRAEEVTKKKERVVEGFICGHCYGKCCEHCKRKLTGKSEKKGEKKTFIGTDWKECKDYSEETKEENYRNREKVRVEYDYTTVEKLKIGSYSECVSSKYLVYQSSVVVVSNNDGKRKEIKNIRKWKR